MKREKILAKNTLIFALGTFGTKFISFLLLPLYTYSLTTNDYGIYDLITTFVTLLVPIVTAQLDNGIYRFLLDCTSDSEIEEVISSSFFTVLFNLIIFNLCYILFVNLFIKFNFKYIILIQINVTIISGIFAQTARGLKYNIIYAMNGIISTIVIIFSNIIFLYYFKLGINALIFSNILANVISIIYLNYKVKISSFIKYNSKLKRLQIDMLKFSIPLISNTISWWIMNVSDRFIINKYMGTSANGIYAVSNKLPSIVVMINYIFYLAWQESAITEYKSEDKSKFYTTMFKVYMTLQFTAVIILISYTPLMLKILVSSKFYEAYKYTPYLYMGALFYGFSSFYGVIYDGAKDTKSAAYTAIIGALFNVVFNIFMIPKWGIQAASFSTMIAFLIMWLLRAYNTQKYIKISIEKKKIVLFTCFSTIFIILYYKNNIMITVFEDIISVIIFILYNKIILISIQHHIKHRLVVLLN